MIEFTFTEVALFCWAVLATGFALKWQQQFKATSRLIVLMVDHPEVRDQIVAAKEAFMKEHGYDHS